MAINKGKGLSGLVGNAISYQRNGKDCLRSRPNKVTQQKKSKESASDFGYSSHSAKLIRTVFHSILQYNKDSEMHNRLTSCVRAIVTSDTVSLPGKRKLKNGNLEWLVNFQFNAAVEMRNVLRFLINTTIHPDGTVTIQLPELNPYRDIKVPKGTSEVVIKMQATSLNVETNDFRDSKTEVKIAYHNALSPPTSVIIKTPVMSYDILIAVISVQFFNDSGENLFITTKSGGPATISAVHHLP